MGVVAGVVEDELIFGSENLCGGEFPIKDL